MTTLNHKYRVTAVLNWAGIVSVENVFMLNVSTAGTDDDEDVLLAAADWLDEAYTWVAGKMHTTIQFQEVRGFNVTEDAPITAVSWPSLTYGTSSIDTNPTGVAALALFHTIRSRVTGRKYVGVFDQNVFDGSLIVAAALTAMVNWCITIAAGPTPLAGGTVLDYGVLAKSGIFYNITRFTVSAIPSYQRRRRQGTGV